MNMTQSASKAEIKHFLAIAVRTLHVEQEGYLFGFADIL
jgi:hypothetical protein